MKTVILICMVWIINLSLISISVSITKPTDGYIVYYSEDGGKTLEEVYTHYHKDGQDKNLAKYENNEKYYKKDITGKLNDGLLTTLNIITTVCSLLLAVANFYHEFWALGDSDQARFELNNRPYNKKRPLIPIFLGYSPFILTYFILLISKLFNVLPSFSVWFYYLNFYAHYIISLLIPNAATTQNSLIGIILSIVVFVPIPAICYTAYIFGTKHIDIKKSLMYKKEKQNG